ncbi:MAG: hypothetical protein JW725_05185 [Candidatus Babeliaceae bacterium]|nr:hypothetical protein [Candidatus Babeliaceae bacterium]
MPTKQNITLSPMLVQYLVGLCCLRYDPEDVDITIGDIVWDEAAKEERDVDVTVTVVDPDGESCAFKAYEVKSEGTPLDVTEVEGLCKKLTDMPSISHRAIVSSSGFTKGEKAKASFHGVDLFWLRPWTRPLEDQFPLLTMRGTADECFPMRQSLLCWNDYRFSLVARMAKGSFTVQPGDQLFDAAGNVHSKYQDFAQYTSELLLRSTEILFPIEPASSVLRTFPIPFSAPEGETPAGPSWPHTHTLDVKDDAVHIQTAGGICQLDFVTITGFLRWERSPNRGQYYVMERVPDGDAFAAALIAQELREGHMTCLVFSSKTRDIGIHFVRLLEKHRNAIRRLKIDISSKEA